MPQLEPVACSSFEGLGLLDPGAQCGYLVVPENRGNPASRTIKVAYAILQAHSANPQPDPVVYLAGGPGDNSLKSDWVSYWLASSLRENRALILVDPRGTGYSVPQMKCPANTPPDAGSQDHPSAEETIARDLAWAQACRALLVSQGFDLTAYSSMTNANDLEDLRQALGYAQWNLYGTSYGTRTALVTMREYPQGLRSVVLDSVLPPQVDRIGNDPAGKANSLATLFAACRADPVCNSAYPNLETTFSETVQQLDRNPIRISVPDAATGQTRQMWVTGGTIIAGASEALMQPVFVQIMPITIQQIQAGNWAIVERLYASLASSVSFAQPEGKSFIRIQFCTVG
jgi:pimeloyl-ACP methyl ester carboxylesterase